MASQKSPSSTVTTTEVRELLRTAAQNLSAREEKIARMRSGAQISRTQALPRRGQGNVEARSELLALEIELSQKLAARSASVQAKRPAPVAATRAKEKDKIVRALRRLK